MIKKNILLAGGKGLIGKILIRHLDPEIYNFYILTRNPEQEREYYWNPKEKIFPKEFLKDIDVIINLSGANLMGKWTKEYKRELIDSRIIPTQYLSEILANNKHKVSCFLNASGISIYGDRGSVILTEKDQAGTGFLEKLCVDWESETESIQQQGIRTCQLRISPVLHPDNEFVKLQKKLASFRALSRLGDGEQYIPWIHYQDFCKMTDFIIHNNEITGPINVCSPNPVTQKDLCKSFERVLGIKQFAPAAPKQALQLFMGKKSQLLLDSIHALPEKLENNGFQFTFPTFEQALENTIKTQNH
jgi:uncharacterized protein (TIGR01777 family)